MHFDWKLLDSFGCQVGGGREKNKQLCKEASKPARKLFMEKAKRAEKLMDGNRALGFASA